MKYVENVVFYLTAIAGAVGGGAALYFGAGQELSDCLRINSEGVRVTIDTIVGITPLLTVGVVGEGVKHLVYKNQGTVRFRSNA
jgi:hypothetical protein